MFNHQKVVHLPFSKFWLVIILVEYFSELKHRNSTFHHDPQSLFVKSVNDTICIEREQLRFIFLVIKGCC
jgi:hypothetical protein